MILLLGGTNETAAVAGALAEAGYRVLVSLATDIPLFIGSHANIAERRGRLDADDMIALVRKERIRAIVDVVHPYASQARATASAVAARLEIPYFSYIRPGVVTQADDVRLVASHEEAARVACEAGKPVLLTIGSKNVQPYAAEARRAGITLVARVLSDADSIRACCEVGIPQDHIVTGRGPFDVEENCRLLRRFEIGVLVTKDSGKIGGVREKLEAARLEQCKVVVVGRPGAAHSAFSSVTEIIREVERRVPRKAPVIALDLESVLIPEIWETVARAVGVSELAVTTRDIPDYAELMRRRISLCRQHGLTLTRLREIVASIEPLPGALEFLGWAQGYGLAVIVSDTFHELAGPVLAKLGCMLTICNWLIVDEDGYIGGYKLRHELGKLDAVAQLQRLGFRVFAVGDSYNDLTMLQAADAGFMFRPPQQLTGKGCDFSTVWSFAELQTELQNAVKEFL